jgi:predicted amidohydrolase YtcJ
VRQGLDAIERAIGVNPDRDRRHVLAHLALIDPADLTRFRELGVTANISTLWTWLGEERAAEVESLGEERAGRLLAFKSLFNSGARVTAGSDWISESMNPLYSIQVALTRRPPDGSGPAWNPEQRVTLEEMLEAYTINGAWQARLEDETGSIEVGKAADLVLLEQNLFEVDTMRLKDVKVLMTLLEGEIVYEAP